jgi:hypothetical protein
MRSLEQVTDYCLQYQIFFILYFINSNKVKYILIFCRSYFVGPIVIVLRSGLIGSTNDRLVFWTHFRESRGRYLRASVSPELTPTTGRLYGSTGVGKSSSRSLPLLRGIGDTTQLLTRGVPCPSQFIRSDSNFFK